MYQKETNVYCTNLCCNSLQRERGSCVTELIPTSLGHELCDFIVILSTSSMWYFGMSHICIVWLYMSRKDASSSWNRTAVGLSTNFPRFLTETMKNIALVCSYNSNNLLFFLFFGRFSSHSSYLRFDLREFLR